MPIGTATHKLQAKNGSRFERGTPESFITSKSSNKFGKRLLMTCHSCSASLTQTQPMAGGLQPLSHVNKTNLRRRFNIENDFELMKHIANLHDGELRMVGEETWEMFPALAGTMRISSSTSSGTTRQSCRMVHPNEDILLMFVFNQFSTLFCRHQFDPTLVFMFPHVV